MNPTGKDAMPIIITLEVAMLDGVSHEVRLAAMFDQVVKHHLAEKRMEPPEAVHAEVGRVTRWMVSRYRDFT